MVHRSPEPDHPTEQRGGEVVMVPCLDDLERIVIHAQGCMSQANLASGAFASWINYIVDRILGREHFSRRIGGGGGEMI